MDNMSWYVSTGQGCNINKEVLGKKQKHCMKKVLVFEVIKS